VILVGQQIADTPNRTCDMQQIGHEIAHEIAGVISPFDCVQNSKLLFVRKAIFCIPDISQETNTLDCFHTGTIPTHINRHTNSVMLCLPLSSPFFPTK
jgi:hypothetical protein